LLFFVLECSDWQAGVSCLSHCRWLSFSICYCWARL